jgi:hypothetical protein
MLKYYELLSDYNLQWFQLIINNKYKNMLKLIKHEIKIKRAIF